jgi:hypothetical protein
MFAIKANEMDTINGRTRRRTVFASPRRAPYPISRLQQMAIASRLGPDVKRDAVQLRGLRISLRVQNVVHACDSNGKKWCRLSRGRGLNSGPQVGLELVGSGFDLLKLTALPSFIEQNALIEIAFQESMHSRRVGGGEESPRGRTPYRWRWPLTLRGFCAGRTDC